jgi:predicted porin
VGGGKTCTFGNATVSLGYEKNRDKSLGDSMDFDTWIVGLKYRIGRGTVNVSYNRADIDDGAYNDHADKYALGYYLRSFPQNIPVRYHGFHGLP